jgi:hypothetical protein
MGRAPGRNHAKSKNPRGGCSGGISRRRVVGLEFPPRDVRRTRFERPRDLPMSDAPASRLDGARTLPNLRNDADSDRSGAGRGIARSRIRPRHRLLTLAGSRSIDRFDHRDRRIPRTPPRDSHGRTHCLRPRPLCSTRGVSGGDRRSSADGRALERNRRPTRAPSRAGGATQIARAFPESARTALRGRR